MNKKLLLLLGLIIGVASLNAQSLKRFKSKATQALEAKDFSRALEYYELILNEADDETFENYYNAAEAAREFRIYNLSEQYYRQILADSAAQSQFQLTNFHLGSVLKNQGRYDEAKQHFQKFLDNNASFVSEKYTAKANKEISDCIWAKEIPDNGARITQLDTTVNTPNSEFSPILLGDELYYSSVRYNTDKENMPETPLTRIYISKESQLGQQISEDFNEDLMHSAHATFNDDASRVYYTICSSVNATDVKCKIYYREKSNDKWGKRVELSDKINSDEYTTTQPSVGFDKYTGKEVLFFASDRPVEGSEAEKNMNIWCAYLEGDSFGDPFQVAEINTDGGDITPFFHTESQTLFFSSQGRQNMGGFDIYSATKGLKGWSEVEHMGAPLNSSYDDVYYSLNTDGTMAYISSNRDGAMCDDENGQCACNDIYEIPQIKIKVLTYNKLTGEPLFGTEVSLENLKTEISKSQSKEADYRYDYAANFDIEYLVDATLENWIPDDSTFTTNNMEGGSVIEIPLYLTPAVDLDALVFNKITGDPLPGAKVEIFEVAEELYLEDDLLGFQQSPESVEYNFGLNFFKKYMVVGSNGVGWSRDTFFVTTQDIPVIPTHLEDRLLLCKTPPGPGLISLYFYNDEPNRRTRSPNTEWTYTDAFDSYISLRQEFNVAFAYDPEELSNIERFFEEDVRGGYKDLQDFTDLLKTYLDQLKDDEKLQVVIRGYASPRAKSDYNYNLTQRRIMSIENYFNDEEILPGYAGRIEIIEEPNGEDKAPSGIEDDIADRKNSIYSRAASRERRVEIIRILIAPDACAPDSTNK